MAEKNSSRESRGVRGHAPHEIFQNIALRLAKIAFPRDIFRNICFHTADLFQNILSCGGVEKLIYQQKKRNIYKHANHFDL